MGAANTCQVTLGTTSLTIQRNPTANNTPEVYPYAHIISVAPVTLQDKANVQLIDQENWKYRFDVITIIEIGLADGRYIPLELQEITNQPTWSTANQAGLNQAVADIQAQL